MTAEPLPPTLLHDRMPEWWRPLTLDLDGAIVDRRRRGVEALRRALARDNVVDAVAFAHGDELAGQRIIALIRSSLRTADPGYAGRVGDLEPPALIAAALADQLAVAPGDDLSTLISLLLGGAAFSNVTPVIQDMPLAEYADRQLALRAERHELSSLRGQQTASELIRELLAVSDPGDGREAVALGALASRLDELTAATTRETLELHEQLRRHAWIADPASETAGVAWAEVHPAARPLLAAVELADRTATVAPAPDADVLLTRMVGESRGLDLDTAVAAAGPFLDGRFAGPPHSVLFPVSSALRRWREAGRREHASPGPSPPQDGERRDPLALALATQAYREALVCRALTA